MIINLSTKRIYVISQKRTFIRVLPTRWLRKPAGIDMERNYVTVTLCVQTKRRDVNFGSPDEQESESYEHSECTDPENQRNAVAELLRRVHVERLLFRLVRKLVAL